MLLSAKIPLWRNNPMKRFSAIAAPLFIWTIAAAPNAHALQCDVCHSRNPAMVRMHREVQGKGIGCFDCHKVGEKLMGKAQPKDRDSLFNRRATEPICMDCHGNMVKQ
jgi:hypothetical protein